jgi:tetratricopeptide (TPR) repeat protein
MRIQLGEVDEVAPVLLKCVNEDHPESALILETLAGSYMNNLRYRPAIICLNRWIKLDPDAARPYHWRGWIHDRMNYAHEAMEDYKEALERDPDLVAPRLRLAELLIEKSNNPPMAREHLDILAEKHPERADVKARLGQCLVAEGRHDLARTLLEEAVESLPKDPLLLITLARLDLVQQRPERAEEWIRRVLKIDPADHEARYVLFTALQQQNRPRDAAMALADSEKYKALVQKVNDLLKLETDQPSSDPATAAEAGRILLQIEQERLGLYWLAQALKRDPNYQSAHKVLAEHYERKGDHENANLHRRKLRNEPRTK